MESPYRQHSSPHTGHRASRADDRYHMEHAHDSTPIDQQHMMLLQSEYAYPHSPSYYPRTHAIQSPSIRSVGTTHSPALCCRQHPAHHEEDPYRSSMPTPTHTHQQKPPSGISSVLPVSFNLSSIFPKNFLPTYGIGLKRQRTVREVELVKGNLVLDCPVPSTLIETSARKDFEFSHMRYSAVTCDPDDFSDSQFTLRPRLQGRQTELFICMTMYNVSTF